MKLRYPLIFVVGALCGAYLMYQPAPPKLEKGCVLAHLYQNENDTMIICGKFLYDPQSTKKE